MAGRSAGGGGGECVRRWCAVAASAAALGVGLAVFWRRVTSSRAVSLPAEGGPVEKLRGLSLLSVADLPDDAVAYLMQRAARMKAARSVGRDGATPARECLVGLLFFEPSTRTRCSFEAAAKLLGFKTVDLGAAESNSSAKGETAADSAKILAQYCDVLVVRHPEKGQVAAIADAVGVPVINAGDGAGEHPTQALLDLLTVQESFGAERLRDFEKPPVVVTFVGDLKYGRTVQSLVLLLSRYNVRLQTLAIPGLELPKDVCEKATRVAAVRNPTTALEPLAVRDLTVAVQTSDVVYMTRVQRERFSDEHVAFDNFHLTASLLARYAPKGQIVMHPLPRNEEIATCVDATAHAQYFNQARNGMFVRMALLESVLGMHLP